MPKSYHLRLAHKSQSLKMAFTTTSKTGIGLTFPHPELTIITGKPTYASVCKLQKELYANSKAIPSMLGGGQNGHLALIMTKAEYLLISAVTYNEPIHPGAQPAHQGNATSTQMTKANRLYDGRITQVSLHVSAVNALRQQILCAVENMYLMALEHPELWYLISPCNMLLHLQDMYGTITPLEIEQNRATFTSAWNPDDDIEGLWLRIRDAQLLAHQANEEILDPAAIRLTVQALEASSGVFDCTLDNWRLKDRCHKNDALLQRAYQQRRQYTQPKAHRQNWWLSWSQRC
jgi:hypothetical protein